MWLKARLEPASLGHLQSIADRRRRSTVSAAPRRGRMVSETTHPYQTPYDPPPYPYDLLDELRAVAQERFGAVIDC